MTKLNEANYSDGLCFTWGQTDLNIGITLGMPTPGTCSFAGWEGLPNGVRWGAVPIFAKNKVGEWLENKETRPQIETKICWEKLIRVLTSYWKVQSKNSSK